MKLQVRNNPAKSLNRRSNSTSNIRKPSNSRQGLTTPRPVRIYKRFPQERVSCSGVDANQSFAEFSSHDIFKTPLVHKELYPQENFHQTSRTNWALQTIKRAPSYSALPKVQPFTTYYFHKPSKDKVEKYSNSYLNNDHISIKVPKRNIESNKEGISYLESKSLYNANTESEKTWEPKFKEVTLNNKSSVKYNIINHEDNNFDLRRTVMKKGINNLAKGIGEFNDMNKIYGRNFSNEYNNAIKKNEFVFRTCNGIFSHLYDSAYRNGNLIVPFKNEKVVSASNKN